MFYRLVSFFTAAVLSFAQSEPPGCHELLTTTRKVPFREFAVELLRARGNIHTLVDRLEDLHLGPNFQISIPLGSRKILIFQERQSIDRILREHARLPYVNKNFDLSHGHFQSINSVDTTDQLWRDLHTELGDIFWQHKITPIMRKYQDILVGESAYNLNEKLEEYFLRVWAEYCFGEVDHEQFVKMRSELVAVLGQVFHQNPFNRLPLLGRMTSLWNRRRHIAQLTEVDLKLSEIVKSAIAQRRGAFYELYHRLEGKYDNAFQITLDNSFLGILVYDFIYIVVLDALAHVAKTPELDLKQQFKTSRHDSFLYPFRFRQIAEDFADLKAGDLCILNLQKAGLYFSSGQRVCVGAGLFNEITRTLSEILADHQMCFVNPDEEITKTGNRDLPFMTSRHDIEVRKCPFHKEEGEQ